MRLWLDIETYSATPIKSGVFRYAADCELLLLAWAVDDDAVQCWEPKRTAPPEDLLAALMDADEVVSHNAAFDRTGLAACLPALVPPLPLWRCTMAQALAHSLPGSLDALCAALKVPASHAKIKEGRALLSLFCKPRPKKPRADHDTHPVEWAAFLEYAIADVVAMRECAKRMPNWNYQGAELELWHLDQAINARGFGVDVELAQAALRAIAKEQTRLAAQTHAMTDGQLRSTSQRDVLLDHIADTYGVVLEDLKGSSVDKLLESDLDQRLRELLVVRQQVGSTSTSKYKTLLDAQVGGRLSGTLQFCGASRTGRWAGRLFQPQNLPSRDLLAQADIDLGITALKNDAADLIFDNVTQLVSSCIRSCITAPPGYQIVASDLSNIEGRGLAWIAGERWKLDAFAAFDAGKGPDLYKLAYARDFGMRPQDVTKAQRQIGKVRELALGFEGGVGAFATFAAAYGIDLEQMARSAWDTLPDDLLRESTDFHQWASFEGRDMFGLSREAFITCDVFKRAWRKGHPATAGLWKELQAAVLDAIETPSTEFKVRALRVIRTGAWLRIVLPSGRSLCYPSPRADAGKISYMGVAQGSRKWERLSTYGGKLVENVTQAVARDVMAANMPTIERAGFRIVLTVHDEIVTEAPLDPAHDHLALSHLLATPPAWAQGMPLAASGFQGSRYRKD